MATLPFQYLAVLAVAQGVAWYAVSHYRKSGSAQQHGISALQASVAELGITLGDANLEQYPTAHIEEGIPLRGRTYFFSVGGFGVAGCQSAFERGEHEDVGGVGHQSCHAKQQRVAAAMAKLSSLKPQFVLSLGGNYFSRGVKDLDDPLFDESVNRVFNVPGLEEVPWKIVLGDHDYRGNVTALQRHSDRSARWSLPSPYYSFEVPTPDDSDRTLEIDVVDTTMLEVGVSKELAAKEYAANVSSEASSQEHWRWLEFRLRSTRPAGRLVVAHRPVMSVVRRSRTDSEHQVEKRLAELLATAGKKSAVVYMHGHDRAFQHWEDRAQGITYLGNGVGGPGLHPLEAFPQAPALGAELRWATNASYGFAIHELSSTALNTFLIDADGARVISAVRMLLTEAPTRPEEPMKPMFTATSGLLR